MDETVLGRKSVNIIIRHARETFKKVKSKLILEKNCRYNMKIRVPQKSKIDKYPYKLEANINSNRTLVKAEEYL